MHDGKNVSPQPREIQPTLFLLCSTFQLFLSRSVLDSNIKLDLEQLIKDYE